MRHFLILLLIFFSNCSFYKKEIQFSGNWKRVQITRSLSNDTLNYENPIELLSFRTDNLVFYYNNLYQYEFNSDYDSLYLMYLDSVGTGSYVRRFKVDFIDLNTMKFSYIRKLVDTLSYEPFDMIYTTTFKKDLVE
tara:strand:+ start:256 stop:663 length:408 start_codon:yes stop_codon:yes gene_type:complete